MNVSARTGARFQEFFTEMEKQVNLTVTVTVFTAAELRNPQGRQRLIGAWSQCHGSSAAMRRLREGGNVRQ
jgi:hypothetical protein